MHNIIISLKAFRGLGPYLLRLPATPNGVESAKTLKQVQKSNNIVKANLCKISLFKY